MYRYGLQQNRRCQRRADVGIGPYANYEAMCVSTEVPARALDERPYGVGHTLSVIAWRAPTAVLAAQGHNPSGASRQLPLHKGALGRCALLGLPCVMLAARHRLTEEGLRAKGANSNRAVRHTILLTSSLLPITSAYRPRGQKKRGAPELGVPRVFYACLGKTTVIVVPWPGVLSSVSLAWWSWTACLTMDKPRPVPPDFLEWLLSTR